ncbi:hypothetical protein DFQ27_002499 [Actinomortierella ambigua]|uniref:Uncharacterized protein n=1 Tax=Actinomortierella ambigua TaxID=1343610 RepID=A0A9P6U652_9FUNG|nr:hypothetical protein DFQ27_002499 [Actinomortierella ambigua]
MLVSVAIGAPEPGPEPLHLKAATPESMVEFLKSDPTYSSIKLPEKPLEHNEVVKISASIAQEITKVLNPDLAMAFISNGKYEFRAHFWKCTPSYAFHQVQDKTGPYSEESSIRAAYNLTLDLGMAPSVAKLFMNLPLASKVINDPIGISVSRGNQSVVSPSVDIKEHKRMQEFFVALGWRCECGFRLLRRLVNGRRHLIASMDFPKYNTTFFPAALKGKPLFKLVWLNVDGA